MTGPPPKSIVPSKVIPRSQSFTPVGLTTVSARGEAGMLNPGPVKLLLKTQLPEASSLATTRLVPLAFCTGPQPKSTIVTPVRKPMISASPAALTLAARFGTLPRNFLAHTQLPEGSNLELDHVPGSLSLEGERIDRAEEFECVF